ncbi:hypothetical protein [Faecalicatena contorta]|uniref:hypothetical protein n=1 Tax=Faecalicatena contorta TaxID=39482 RepID=UPI000D6B4B51|nr:hypothetical protein [Faecalicatena contorta]
MLAFSNNNYELDFGAKQSVELFCAYVILIVNHSNGVNIEYSGMKSIVCPVIGNHDSGLGKAINSAL